MCDKAEAPVSWSFVAMEYYVLILNRTYVLDVDAKNLHGKVCRGVTGVEGGDGLTRLITKRFSVSGDLNDPITYVRADWLKRTHSADFSIELAEICQVEYDPRKKWGMGYYPHDGRVIVTTAACRREFIILGSQLGREIATRLRVAVERSSATRAFAVDMVRLTRAL